MGSKYQDSLFSTPIREAGKAWVGVLACAGGPWGGVWLFSLFFLHLLKEKKRNREPWHSLTRLNLSVSCGG